MNLEQFFQEAIQAKAADIFIIGGKPLCYSCGGQIVSVGEKLLPPDTEELIRQIYQMANRTMDSYLDQKDDDFSFSLPSLGRFRVNTFMQRGSMAAVLRIVVFQLPDPTDLGIPQQVMDIHKMTKGLVLVTGPAGSGKSTTLACLIDAINRSRQAHIITLEDPLEYIHRHDLSIVSQREVHTDTASYARGLRAALREAPNVILLGEMRDFETIAIAMSAAETGQLVLSTLHTLGAANTIDRIVDVFPPNQQQQVRVQLSMVLKGVVSQQLVPATDGKLAAAFEVMFCSNAIRTMIRESKSHQIDSTIQSSADQGMFTMDNSLFSLYEQGRITGENAYIHSMNRDMMKKKLGIV